MLHFFKLISGTAPFWVPLPKYIISNIKYYFLVIQK